MTLLSPGDLAVWGLSIGSDPFSRCGSIVYVFDVHDYYGRNNIKNITINYDEGPFLIISVSVDDLEPMVFVLEFGGWVRARWLASTIPKQ